MKAILAIAALALACVASAAQAKVQFIYTVSSAPLPGSPGSASMVGGTFTTGTAPADFTSSIKVTDSYITTGNYDFTGSNFNNWVLPSQQFTSPPLNATLTIDFVKSVTGTYTADFTDGIIDYSGPVLVTVSTPSGSPEPGAWALMLLGVAGVGGMLRRGRARTATILA